MAATAENKLLSWDEIKKRHPDEWVVLGEPTWDGITLLSGIVISHHPDKRVASIEGGEHRKEYKMVTLRFTGKAKPVRTIGYMRTINPIKPS